MRNMPDDEDAYCCECGEPCSVVWTDEGIGVYEYWGARGVHVDWQASSSCCEAEVTDTKPEQEIEDDQDLSRQD